MLQSRLALSSWPTLRCAIFSSKAPRPSRTSYGPNEPITGVKKGDVLYVDMRSYGQLWYDESLEMLEDRFDKKFIVESKVTDAFATRVNAFCDVLQEIWDKPRGAESLGSYWFFAWAYRTFDGAKMVLVTKDLLLRFPRLISWDSANQRHHFPDLQDVDQILEA